MGGDRYIPSEEPVPLRWVPELEAPSLDPSYIIVPRGITPAAIVASLDPIRSHRGSIEKTVLSDCFVAILGTGRGKVAHIALGSREALLVDSDGGEKEPL